MDDVASEIHPCLDLAVLDSRIREQITVIHACPSNRTLASLKEDVVRSAQRKGSSRPYAEMTEDRVEFRLTQNGPPLNNLLTLRDIFGEKALEAKIYVKDLGPQIPYSAHLLAQYFTALAGYSLFFARVPPFYSSDDTFSRRSLACQAAALAWTSHFGRKIYEINKSPVYWSSSVSARVCVAQVVAVMVATMLIAFENNDPSFMGPRLTMLCFALVLFFLCELGSHRIHSYLRVLRIESPKGLTFPMPSADPFTHLFDLVSCPMLTYDLGAMFFYFLLTRNFYVLLALLFLVYRLTHAALIEHDTLRKAFPQTYPKARRAIFPFII